jgi:aldose 1-epimerase
MEKTDFGITPQGESVSLYTLEGPGGLRARITNYGGIVTELHVPDREGRSEDVVLGFSTLAPYLAGHPYFGALVGRVSGRLTRGRFTLKGRSHQLACNDGPNHLHGGLVGLDKRLWTAHADGESLSLSYHSPDGEEGYPGNVDLTVTYSLTPDQALTIDYSATTDRETPLSLTNHSYFHLGGEGSGDALDHHLQIFSDIVTPFDGDGTLLGRCESVSGSAGDFRQSTPLRERVDGLFRQHGDQYVFADPGPELQLVASLIEPVSGRIMEVLTSERFLQFYTAMHLDGSLVGKRGRAYERYAGLCLECQGYPDAPNQEKFPSTILVPGQTYRQTTCYRFSTL